MGYRLYGVIGDEAVLGELRHPTMHPMHPLCLGLGLCAVRTEVAKDEAPAGIAEELVYLTEPVAGYAQTLSQRTPVIYVAADFFGGVGDQAACGWSQGQLALGPLASHHPHRPRPHRWLRRSTGAINDALAWLGISCRRGRDQFGVVGLDQRRDWET